MSLDTTLFGRVASFDENTLWGTLELRDGRAVIERRFHSTSFDARTAFRWPRVGESIKAVFNENGTLLSVEAVDVWTLDLALELIRDVEPVLAAHGWHASLAGSVLLKGYSTKDVDLVVFPHCKRRETPTAYQLLKLHNGLKAAGMKLKHSRLVVQSGKRWKESGDTKHVEIWIGKGRRVDVIVLS